MKNVKNDYIKGFQDGKRFVLSVLRYTMDFELNNPDAEITEKDINDIIRELREMEARE